MLEDYKSATTVSCFEAASLHETDDSQGILKRLGITLSTEKVCPDHSSQSEVFTELLLKRPSIALVHGARGVGKSYLAAIETHISSLRLAGLRTRILGGSQAQSKQIYQAIQEIRRGSGDTETEGGPLVDDPDAGIETANANLAIYRNESEVSILSASHTSVRGPHVQNLRLDEVDEIPEDIREAAMGMCMSKDGISASVVMTSTWHRVNGPMSELMKRGQAGAFPVFTMCIFEVLERCPESRSGPNLEKCPECPIFVYCHSHLDRDGRPKAKRSNGYYAIDALIQKLALTSKRIFECDFLCLHPRADGAWFSNFDEAIHVSPTAVFNPNSPVYLAIDSGVFTGAVFFQTIPGNHPSEPETICVFADYSRENLTAEQNALAILELARQVCNGRIDKITTDPAGGSRNPIGPTVIGEYERVGLRPMMRWPLTSVADGLALIEILLSPADGKPRLLIHPRCVSTIQALRYYRRAKRGGQWQDYPEDPQHPHEDIIDALRGGLMSRYPQGRYQSVFETNHRISARQVF